MPSSQPMTLVLCQVVVYPPLEENDEHRVRDISSTTNDTHCPQTEFFMYLFVMKILIKWKEIVLTSTWRKQMKIMG